MAFVNPTRQHDYMGSFADDAACLAFVQAQMWDTAGTGAGTIQQGFVYDDTTLNVRKVWQNGAWEVVANRAWVTAQIIAGRTWRETLLVQDQLVNGAAGGISPAILLSVTGLPTATDTLTIEDGVAPETYTFVAGAPGAFEIQIGGTVAACMDNIVTSLTANSLLWEGVVTAELDPFFAAPTAVQLVICRQLAQATAANTDRIFATLTGAGAIQVVEFATALESDYELTAGTEAAIPAADPAARRFGFGRAFAALADSERHALLEINEGFMWEADGQTWRRSMVPDVAANLTGVVNPNAGAGTPGAIGDQFTDTVGGATYVNQDGTATGWAVSA